MDFYDIDRVESWTNCFTIAMYCVSCPLKWSVLFLGAFDKFMLFKDPSYSQSLLLVVVVVVVVVVGIILLVS